MNLISVIISTYNWPEALELCLESLLAQHDSNFEIVIADDGSRPETQQLIEKYIRSSTVPILHVYQEDKGFRLSTIRNKAVARCRGDYLIFMDGDCIAFPDFIHRHRRLAEANYLVAGNRVLLSQEFTQDILAQKTHLHNKELFFFLTKRLQGKVNRFIPLLALSLGQIRYLESKRWNKVLGCNIGVWKNAFLSVNGFDESFEGWGYEDSDFAIRLIRAGVRRKEGRFAVAVLHLWHPQHNRNQQNQNYQRLMERVSQPEFILAKKGISSYLDSTFMDKG